MCFNGAGGAPYAPLCRKLHKRWFDIRKDLESTSVWRTFTPERYTGAFESDEYHGFCKRGGKSGYIPIPLDDALQIHTGTQPPGAA